MEKVGVIIEGKETLSKASKQAEKGTTSAFDNIKKSVFSADNAVKTLATSVGGFYAVSKAVDLAGQYTGLTDQYKNLNSQIRLVTDSQQELIDTRSDLLDLANDTRSQIDGTVRLYSKLSRATEKLGTSEEDLLIITEAINQAIQVSGASAVSADAAMLQFGQGISAGAVRGEELNSILEQTPRLAQAIADGMGVAVGDLKALGAEGAITAEKVIEGLKSQAEQLDKEFSQIEPTVEQSFTVLKNNLAETIGQFDEAVGASEALSKSISGLADAIKPVKEVIDPLKEVRQQIAGLDDADTREALEFYVDKFNEIGEAKGFEAQLKRARNLARVTQRVARDQELTSTERVLAARIYNEIKAEELRILNENGKKQDENLKKQEEAAKRAQELSEIPSSDFASMFDAQLYNLNLYLEKSRELEQEARENEIEEARKVAEKTLEIEVEKDKKLRKLEEDRQKLTAKRVLSTAGIIVDSLKTIFGENKALASLEAAINTAAGVTRLYRDLPLPAAIAATPFVVAAGAKQISDINSKNFYNGGYHYGQGGPTSDSMTARVSPGEFTVNAASTSENREVLEDINEGRYNENKGNTFIFQGSVWFGSKEEFYQEVSNAEEYNRVNNIQPQVVV